MPAHFIIDEAHRVVFSKGTGVFTYEEGLDYMTRLLSDPQFCADFDQIVDCREVIDVKLSAEQVRELANRSGFSAKSRRVFVASTDLHFGLSRMFGAYNEARGGSRVVVVREMKEALQWLGLSTDNDHGAAQTDGANPDPKPN